MKLSGDWLVRPQTQAVFSALTGGGYRAFFVGGCVRNALLGQQVADIDIATDTPPEVVIKLARAVGLKTVPTGLAHGTVTVVSGGLPHEVTTFRRDTMTDGRHAVVAFSDSIAEDAARRDFTMNALYATPQGDLVDPLNGLPDLVARRLRFVGDPRQRIGEDALRILRFFRFQAWYADPQDGIDPDALAACADLADGIDRLSRERVGAEMRKLLSAPDPAPAVAAMEASGILTRVLPGASGRSASLLVHLEEARPPRWLRRLAVLGGDDLAVRLRLARGEAQALADLRAGVAGTLGAAELGYRHGSDLAGDIVLARAALQDSAPPAGWPAEAARGAVARFPVSAADLMPALSGPALGQRLTALENRWIASGFALSRQALLNTGPGHPQPDERT